MTDYYAFLSSLTNLVGDPLRSLDERISVPLITALILGLIGSTSPCQLTTNVTALAYISRETTEPRRVVGSALAFLTGKIIVYSLLGIAVVAVGLQLSGAAVPVVVFVRKALGPLLIILGLLMLGVLKPNVAVGHRLSEWLEERARKGGRIGPLLLGVAFSFVFCPTLFWLFFGLLVPMSLSSREGLVYPGIFALGTTLPLLFLIGLLAVGVRNMSSHLHRIGRFDLYARRAVGIIFIIGGINEIVLYWL